MKRNYIIIFCLFLLSTGVCLGKGNGDSFSTKENPLFETKNQEILMNTVQSPPKSNEGGDSIFVTADVLPEFPGGYAALTKYLSSNLVYPNKAKETGIQGRVMVKFVVEEDGRTSHIEIIQSVGGGCDEEVIRLIEQMPKWKPGKSKGKPIRCWFMLPIKFSLRE